MTDEDKERAEKLSKLWCRRGITNQQHKEMHIILEDFDARGLFEEVDRFKWNNAICAIYFKEEEDEKFFNSFY